jgi:FkbM family methyltransferase
MSTMISYAQNHEDVVLDRVFGARQDGFYIDVGAFSPIHGSVTKHFSDRGWRGINIEPSRPMFQQLQVERPRDVNLELGISDHAGTMTLYEYPFTGRSTLCRSIAEGAAGLDLVERQVDVRTLREVCVAHAPQRIEFLKIDVEGHEAEVLAGADWSRWRPIVVVVEATVPGSRDPSHRRWEWRLRAADYRLALFDGLNRFYVRAEDRELLPHLAVPANVFDDFVPYEQWCTQAALEQVVRDCDHLADKVRRIGQQVRAVEHRLAVHRRWHEGSRLTSRRSRGPGR